MNKNAALNSNPPPARPDFAAVWLRAVGLGFNYGPRAALIDVDAELRPGQHYIVAGPNGSGKSTLLDLMAGLKNPAAGRVEVMGRSVCAFSPRELSRVVALAPQETRLDFPFTVREVVAMGRRPHLGRWGVLGPSDWKAVDSALDALALTPLAGRAVTALSGGERRRVVVARAIAQGAPVLLLDEPAAGLDVAQALALMGLARRLAEAGRLVVTVSHDLNMAARFGHAILFLKDGRLAAMGSVAEVFTDANLSAIYGACARVRQDEFTGAPAAAFRL